MATGLSSVRRIDDVNDGNAVGSFVPNVNFRPRNGRAVNVIAPVAGVDGHGSNVRTSLGVGAGFGPRRFLNASVSCDVLMRSLNTLRGRCHGAAQQSAHVKPGLIEALGRFLSRLSFMSVRCSLSVFSDRSNSFGIGCCAFTWMAFAVRKAGPASSFQCL